MVSAVDRLVAKLAQTQVRSYLRRTESGEIVRVEQHRREVASPRFFSVRSDADAWGRPLYADWVAGLPDPIRFAIEGYRGSAYRHVNAGYRGPEALERQRQRDNAAFGHNRYTAEDYRRFFEEDRVGIETAMMSAPPVPEDVTVFRSMPSGTWKVGQEITDEAFVSTTLTRDRADEFTKWGNDPKENGTPGSTVTAEIVVPAGTKAAYLDALGEVPWEAELLLDRGKTFIVESVNPLRLRVVR